MSDFDDRNSRSNTVNFTHGSITLVVDHWSDGFRSADLDLDHLMGTVVTAVYDDITALNKAVEKSTGGVTKHASTRSMSVNETSARVKVSVNLTSPMSSISLASYVETILTKAAACMLHVVDPSAMEETKSSNPLDGLLSSLGVMFGEMPPEVADLLGGAFGQPSRAGAGAYRTADAGPNTGQYL